MIATCLDSMTEATSLNCAPCAKINLFLRVGGRREDGFHALQSLAVGVDLRDRLTMRKTSKPGVRIRCSDPSLSTRDNLVVRACEQLAPYVGVPGGLEIELDKQIPVAGGMGGGSSDAAAALRMANRLWGLGLDDIDLALFGSRIGSDVPLFFGLPAVHVSGRGDIVQSTALAWRGWALLVSVDVEVSTPAVYSELDRMRELEFGGSAVADLPLFDIGEACGEIGDIRAVRRAADFEHLLSNDLEPAVFRVAPAVSEVFRAINVAPLGPFRVSGAGSTLYRLFDTSESAHVIAHSIARLNLGVRCMVAAVPTGHGLID